MASRNGKKTARKSKPKRAKKKTPTLAGLVKALAKHRDWIMALKGNAGMGGWTWAQVKKAGGRPNYGGGPPPYP